MPRLTLPDRRLQLSIPMQRPLIAVTSSERGNSAAWIAARWLIDRAGGRAIRVRPSRLIDSFGPIDGLVVLGGVDVDPLLYGGTREVGRRIETPRDERELEMIRDALVQGLPVLGICRGAQLLNVSLGGTLMRLPRSRVRSPLPYRRARIKSDSVLRRVIGRPLVWINTLHDYTVDQLGAGLAISGVDSDGVAQAIELQRRPLALGVQWHPELMPYARASRRLFAALIATAAVKESAARPGATARKPDR